MEKRTASQVKNKKWKKEREEKYKEEVGVKDEEKGE